MTTADEPSSPSWRLQGGALGPMVAFLFGVPVLLGFLLGAMGAGAARYFAWEVGVLFWVAASVGVWLCLAGGSVMAAYALRPWSPAVWVVLLCGAILGSLLGRHVIFGLLDAMSGMMLPGHEARPMRALEPTIDFARFYIQGWAGVFVLWLIAGLGFARWQRRSGLFFRRNIEAADPGAHAPSTPLSARRPELSKEAQAFLGRVPSRLGHDVIALEACDHYVRVHTERGNTLVLGRLADAAQAYAALDGVRVHRSWWVRKSAVSAMTPSGRGHMLHLVGGLQAPVSHSFREIARQAGFPEPAGKADPDPRRA